MSKQQRAALDADLRSHPAFPPDQSIDDARSSLAAVMARMAVPTGVRTSPTTLGGIPGLLIETEAEQRPGTIVYFHGGSWVAGSPETALCLTANLVKRTGITAISLDYRLAPEHPFPAAIDDGVAAYRALLEAGTDPASIAFAGDSAGGGLSVTTCLKARAAGLPLPAALVLLSPGTDATRTGKSMDTKAGIDPFLSRESMAHTGAWYVGNADPNQELLTPATLGDLSGFPPMLIQAGTNEVLLDDATRLADRAREADVDVILDITAGVPHVFQAFWNRLEEADQALDRAAQFLTQKIRS